MVYNMGKWWRWRRLTPCVACGARGRHEPFSTLGLCQAPMALCSDCTRLLPWNYAACQRCALPLSLTPELADAARNELTAERLRVSLCGRCLQRPPLFHHAAAALTYDYPAAPLIQRLKYGDDPAMARVLAQLLAHYLHAHYALTKQPWPQALLPVPLHAGRYRQRGYNQCIEVSRTLGRLLRIPMRTQHLERTRHTAEQAGLTRRARRRNVRNAFAVTDAVLPAHVAIVDDVITTASTVSEVTRMLRKAGVARVDVWGVARTDVSVTRLARPT